MNIELLIQNGESETVEFKERITSPEMLARIISAFSNTNGGTILIGIKEPNVVVGINPEQFERIYQRAIQRVTGTARTASQIVNLQEKSVGVITVEKATAPVGSSEGYFTRIGSSDRALGPESLSALFQKKLIQMQLSNRLAKLFQSKLKKLAGLESLSRKPTHGSESFFMHSLGH